MIEALRQALRVAGDLHGEVAVDLSHVSTVDSMALGVLVSAHRQLRRRGRGLAVIEVPPRIGAVLQLTGLSKLLVVLPAATQPPAASAGQVRPARRACGLPGP